MKKKPQTYWFKLSTSVQRPKSLAEARTLVFGQCEGSIEAETCSPPKRVMTSNKEPNRQQRSNLHYL